MNHGIHPTAEMGIVVSLSTRATCLWLVVSLSTHVSVAKYDQGACRCEVKCCSSLLFPSVVSLCYFQVLFPSVISKCCFPLLFPSVVSLCYFWVENERAMLRLSEAVANYEGQVIIRSSYSDVVTVLSKDASSEDT
jgi:hypothetical protein